MSTPYPFRRGLLAQHVALGSRGQQPRTEAGDAAAKQGDDDRTTNAARQVDSGRRDTRNAPAPHQPRR
jgi:hypothetical protein